MSATQERIGASIEELNAAMAAVRRGEFAVRRPVTFTQAGQIARAARNRAAPPGSVSSVGWPPTGRAVAVLAAHSGAGASTVSVAIAEALQATSPLVRLVELADVARSGLAAATDAELGEGMGWCRGRRRSIIIDRFATPLVGLDQVSPPRRGEADEVVVVDVGWPASDALAASGWVATVLTSESLVVVCRATVPGIRQAEYVLAELAERSPLSVVLAAVGPVRWPGAVAASAGPHVHAARASARVVPVPVDRRIEVDGITADPLPKALTAAGNALLAALPSRSSGGRRTPILPSRRAG